MPDFTSVVSTLPETVPFVGPEAQERARGKTFDARIGANENVFGPSPKAVAAMQAAAGDVWQYADPENHDLKAALAGFHGVTPENLVIGEGIDGLLGYLVRMTVEPGVRVVTSAGAYPTFNYHVAGFGGTLETVPYRDDHEDPDALVAAADGARLVYLANPDNPMGSFHGPDVIRDMIRRLPKGALLVLDEAYGEFAPELIGTDEIFDNVIRFRTFSKAYGMAGARVGYGICAVPLARAFDRIRNHFGMCRISVAGALAALQDVEWLEHTREVVAGSRDKIAAIARENGLGPLPSAANFVAIDCGKDGDFARSVLAGLIEQGVFVRMPFVAPQDRCIRISCGRAAEMTAFEAALPGALSAAAGG